MKFIFVAPRFHTNQVPIVEELMKRGHAVTFIAQFIGASENHSLIEPVVFEQNLVFKIRNYFYQKRNPNPLDPHKFARKFGMPSISKYLTFFIRNHPDVVIVRDRHLKLSKMTFIICKLLKIDTILYLQIPKLDLEHCEKNSKKIGILSRINRYFEPRVIITPLLGKSGLAGQSDSHIYHVPLIGKVNDNVEGRSYFRNDKINIISIGKFVPRKRHLTLLHVLNEIKNQFDVNLTIIGELTTENHKVEFDKLTDYIAENQLENIVKIKINLDFKTVQDEYLKHDLFVMPSINEPLSISPLEAMGCKLPVICSDTSGTSEYIDVGQNGYVFKSDDEQDLKKKMIDIISDREKFLSMGEHSLELIRDQYSQERYYHNLMHVIETEFHYKS